MLTTVKMKLCKRSEFGWRARPFVFALFVLWLAVLDQGQSASAHSSGGRVDGLVPSPSARYDLDLVQDPSIRLGDGSKRLSDINILLPLQNCSDCRRAFKVVTAINGCYSW